MTPRKPSRAIVARGPGGPLVPPGPTAQQEIKVGGIFDLTGITSDVGKPFAQGVQDCACAWVNDNGGINGKKIKLIGADYAYKIDRGPRRSTRSS